LSFSVRHVHVRGEGGGHPAFRVLGKVVAGNKGEINNVFFTFILLRLVLPKLGREGDHNRMEIVKQRETRDGKGIMEGMKVIL
jgi:hypothetical protein